MDYSDSGVAVHVFLSSGYGENGTAEGDLYDSIENVWGSPHNDFLRGHGGANDLYGADGSDTLDGSWGPDHLDGGEGLDFAHYLNSPGGVIVSLLCNVGYGYEAEGDTFTGIETSTGRITTTISAVTTATTFCTVSRATTG